MKKLAILLIFLLFWVTETCWADENELPPPPQTFKEACIDCSAEITLEKEIKETLDIIPVYVTLDECIDVAMKNNFNLASNSNIYTSKKYKFQDAMSQFLPDAKLNYQLIYNNGQVLVGGLLVDNFNEVALTYGAMISHDLTQGGKLIFEAKAAKNFQRASYHKLQYTKTEVLLQTALSYYKTLRSKLQIEIYIKNYTERLAQLKLVEIQECAGLGTKFDVMRAENERLQAKQRLLVAANTFRLNQAELANVMGINVITPVTPVEEEISLYELIESEQEVEDLYQLALDNREDLKGYKREISALRDERHATFTEFVPNASVNAQFAYQGTVSAGLGPHGLVMANVDFPVGQRLGFSTINKANAQFQEIKSMENNLRQKLQDVKEDIIGAYYSSKISKQKSEIAREQIDFSIESVRLAEMRQKAGEGILIDVIQAQNLKTEARIEYLDTVIEFNGTQIKLLFDSGIISPANILKNYSP